MQVLIIEDERKTAAFIRRGLNEEGFRAEVVHDGRAGLDAAQAQTFDLILLDVMLPGMAGWEVLQRLRESGNQTPVILLTVLNGVEDRSHAMELGADGYLTKPFPFSELLARITEVLHPRFETRADLLRFGNLEIDLAAECVHRRGTEIALTQQEFSLLALLATHPGELLSVSRIAEGIWAVPGDAAVVDRHVRRLRNKLGDQDGNGLIHTIKGRGYLLEQR
ncbi:response regulator transcription factor [Geomesophilobacter sediminis]|uniref:Response regulator transcription factor n=1 Tax=Geomesophilobacter sediminis TaxID=2798584 RepID=A0A8J7SCM6_9BACT|nr:response regulator transcription factor [Geomesophilobacter sediminis]MBJ6727274.1 response regulator transcription factor [Geomesophilobacter sediminis]